jgi:hypothetical protein
MEVTQTSVESEDSEDLELRLLNEIFSLPNIFVLFGCKTCGLPWKEHNESCCQHKNKSKYEMLFKIAWNNRKDIDEKLENMFRRAKADGWTPPEDLHVAWKKEELKTFQHSYTNGKRELSLFEKVVKRWSGLIDAFIPKSHILCGYHINNRCYETALYVENGPGVKHITMAEDVFNIIDMNEMEEFIDSNVIKPLIDAYKFKVQQCQLA